MSDWVSVVHEMPDRDVCVDIWASASGGHHHGDSARVENCFFDRERGRWWKWDKGCEYREYLIGLYVTHWMPLPEPPNDRL